MDTQKRIIVWVSAFLIVGITAIGAYQVATGAPKELPKRDGTLGKEISSSDWTKGAINPKVTIVEYSDFECPACAAYAPLVDEVFNEYKDKISFTYRNFPLPQHKNALAAAYAAEAAGKQGKFWEMSTLLFKNQSAWTGVSGAPAIFEGYAQELKLDLAKFKKDVASDEVKALVKEDAQSGTLSALDHTPTFFINGKMADNPRSKEEFVALIEYAIAHP